MGPHDKKISAATTRPLSESKGWVVSAELFVENATNRLLLQLGVHREKKDIINDIFMLDMLHYFRVIFGKNASLQEDKINKRVVCGDRLDIWYEINTEDQPRKEELDMFIRAVIGRMTTEC